MKNAGFPITSVCLSISGIILPDTALSAELNSVGRGFQHAFLLIYALVTECCFGALVALALTRTSRHPNLAVGGTESVYGRDMAHLLHP